MLDLMKWIRDEMAMSMGDKAADLSRADEKRREVALDVYRDVLSAIRSLEEIDEDEESRTEAA